MHMDNFDNHDDNHNNNHDDNHNNHDSGPNLKAGCHGLWGCYGHGQWGSIRLVEIYAFFSTQKLSKKNPITT